MAVVPLSRHHPCHALGCEIQIPPAMHMHKEHWKMVPTKLRDALWDAYKPGQERRMDPSPKYLRAAAACVRAVAEKEGYSEDEIALECDLYTTWAEMLEDD